MGTRSVRRRLFVPLASVCTLGALGLAAPAMASPGTEKTAISETSSTLTVVTDPGVNNALTATLVGADQRGVPGATLVFATQGSAAAASVVLCSAVTNAKGVASCSTTVGLDPALITTSGLSQLADVGKYTVTYAGDNTYAGSKTTGSSTFYGTPPLPVSARS